MDLLTQRRRNRPTDATIKRFERDTPDEDNYIRNLYNSIKAQKTANPEPRAIKHVSPTRTSPVAQQTPSVARNEPKKQ